MQNVVIEWKVTFLVKSTVFQLNEAIVAITVMMLQVLYSIPHKILQLYDTETAVARIRTMQYLL